MIPKIIHYVWLGGEKNDLFFKCLDSWKKFSPDYEIKEWNENNFDFSDSLYATQAYSQKKYGFVADYIRVKVLHEYGGFYLDTDVELVKSLDDFINDDFVSCFENEVYIETAVLGAKKNHPFMNMMVDFYAEHSFMKNNKIDYAPSTPIWTILLEKFYKLELKNTYQKLMCGKDNDEYTITIYPNDYFCPINYTSKKMTITDNTHAIHYFSATWFTKKLKFSEKCLKVIYNLFGKRFFAFLTRIYVSNIRRRLKKDIQKLENKMQKEGEYNGD